MELEKYNTQIHKLTSKLKLINKGKTLLEIILKPINKYIDEPHKKYVTQNQDKIFWFTVDLM